MTSRSRTAVLDASVRRALEENARPGGRPVVLTHATVRTLDPATGDLDDADVVVAGATVGRVGRGVAATVEGAVVVDCTGATLVPAAGAGAGGGPERLGALTPGSPATFAVLPSSAAGTGPLETLVWYPDRAVAVVVDGVVTRWHGRPTAAHPAGAAPRTVEGPHLGAWVDAATGVEQLLTADGRYDETRGGRPHTYVGAYWVAGEHVVYRDDLGFWAYGRFRDGVLHHVDFRFRRRRDTLTHVSEW